jgi:Xaa-Pro aminopeptidase
MAQHEQRRDRLRSLLRKKRIDSLLVTNFTNVTYLTGFTGDDSYLLVTEHGAIVLSDSRYVQQLAEECPDVDVAIRRTGVEMADAVRKAVRSLKTHRLGVEAASMTMAVHRRLEEKLSRVELVPTEGLVEQLREIKDRQEIRVIRDAVQLAQRAFGVIRSSLRPDQTEKEIAYNLEHQIRLFGGTGCSFTPIVGVGPRAALPHATLSDRCVGDSDFVLIDWGALAGGYLSDLTRILVTGKISPKLERIYGVVLRAQRAGIAAIRPGVPMKDVDHAARSVIEDAGFGKRFGHGLGHGIGMEIHESPRLASNQDRPLKTGMVITVEPGIYLPGWGGVRIEDDVLVTRTGHEVLSTVPKEFGDTVLY